jgi:hypothetical protein
MLEVIFERPLRRHNPVDHAKMQSLALGHVGAFLGHGAFRKQYQERNRKGQHRDHPKTVEIGKRRHLLLTQVFDRIGGLLKKDCPCMREKGIGCRIEVIAILAEPQVWN